MALTAVTDVSTVGMVAVVSIVGFTTSWVQTARISRSFATRPAPVRAYHPVA